VSGPHTLASASAAARVAAPDGGWFARACELEREALRCDRAAEGCAARAWYREANEERLRADALRARARACHVLASLAGDPR
jgi:hypothetical protein